MSTPGGFEPPPPKRIDFESIALVHSAIVSIWLELHPQKALNTRIKNGLQIHRVKSSVTNNIVRLYCIVSL